MKRVHVHIVATPCDYLSFGLHFQVDKIDDRSRRRMLSLDPLRVNEGEWSGSYGKHELRMKEVFRSVAQIYGNLHRLLSGLRVAAADDDEAQYKGKCG